MRRAKPVSPYLLVIGLAVAGCRDEGTDELSAEAGASATDEAAVEQPMEGGATANPLLNPSSEAMNETAPDLFQATFETTKGDFTIEVRREWAPNGADRFYSLVRNGFFDGVRFFRVLEGFVAQFGISGDPRLSAIWRQQAIPDDPVQASNTRGYVTYAMAGPNTRTTQIFINFGDNSQLDGMGFAPFGQVVSGMEVVDALHSGYGEGAPRGSGPSQPMIQSEGNAYLEREFPQLDYVERAFVVETDD